MSSAAVEAAAARAAAERDRALRAVGGAWRRRGVVHTPPGIARYVARAVDAALRRGLGCGGGLADGRVALADPACGPGAFLAAALAVAGDRPGSPRATVGLDLDPEALALAGGVLGGAAAAAGWPLTLRRADTLSSLDPFDGALGRDGVAVVMGNPPWAGRTANAEAEVVGALLEDFRRDGAGQRLGERKLGVLSDDYVRFWRWAAEIARRAPGGGVVGLVTNASFLDGPVHRGMRGALVRWFDGVEVVDLGGSALVARDGRRDENLFGVRPAAAVTVAWRRAGEGAPRGRVRFGEVTGRRADKLDALERLEPSSLGSIPARPPGFLFRPTGRASAAYEGWVSLADAMPFHREGVQTNRDAVVVDADRDALLERLVALARGSRRADLEPALRPSRHYDPAVARAALAEALERDPDGTGGELMRRIDYRPFDRRWLCPVRRLCHRPRPALLAAVRDGEPVLLTVRKDRGQRPWSHVGVAYHLPDNCWLSTRSSCRTRAFPLRSPDGTPNLSAIVADGWSERLGVPVDAEGFLLFALGVLAAPSYRRAFDAALRIDYPRVPAPEDRHTFDAIRAAGRQVAAAFAGPAGGDPVEVGHHRTRSSALHAAVAAADHAVGPLLRASR